METLNLWLDNDMITTDQLMDELLRRDPSLSDRLHETQQWNSSTTGNSNATHVYTSVDDPGRMEVEHIPDKPAITIGSDHPGDNIMGDVTLSDSASGMVNGEGDCTIDADVGN